MTMPLGKCPRCGLMIQATKMHAEEVLVGIEGEAKGKVHGAQRTFLGTCSTHGQVFAHQVMGHHTTIGEAQLKRRYAKPVRQRIIAALDPTERARFYRAIDGKLQPDDADIRRWDRLASQPISSRTSHWLGSFRLRQESPDD